MLPKCHGGVLMFAAPRSLRTTSLRRKGQKPSCTARTFLSARSPIWDLGHGWERRRAPRLGSLSKLLLLHNQITGPESVEFFEQNWILLRTIDECSLSHSKAMNFMASWNKMAALGVFTSSNTREHDVMASNYQPKEDLVGAPFTCGYRCKLSNNKNQKCSIPYSFTDCKNLRGGRPTWWLTTGF